jgi:hypothetical protein
MQVFEVLELREFPYFLTVEVEEGKLVRDILTEINNHKVFLLVDHDTKRIWTYNGRYSPLKLQIYGGILAGMLRSQLRLFYRVYPLNLLKTEDKVFQEILEKPLGVGRAKSIEKSDFQKEQFEKTVGDLIIHNPRFKSALENLNSYPFPEDFLRIFIIIGGIVYSEEEITETMLKELKTSLNIIKMGQLNNGFTFFDDRNYSIRLIIKDRAIQGIELFVHKSDKVPLLHIKTPLIPEEHLNRKGDIKDLIRAFQISDSLSDMEVSEKESQN